MRWRLLLPVALLVAGCGPFFDGIGSSSEQIADAVHAAALVGKTFRLADVTDFEWDRFYVFAPYTPTEAIDKRLGFHWGDAEHSDIRWDDTMSLLVFVRDGEVVEAFDQDNGDGYFACVEDRPLTPSEAQLRVKRVHESTYYFDVVDVPGPKSPGCVY